MKHKKGDVNHYVNHCKQFYQKNTVFCFDTCRTSKSESLKNEASANKQEKQKQRKVDKGSSPLY